MRKIILSCLILLWILSAAGCGNRPADDAKGAEDAVNSENDAVITETVTSSEAESAELKKVYGYVCRVKTSGFVVSINDVGYVYVRCSDAKDKFETYNTVIIEYAPADLKEQRGFYLDDAGEIQSYSFMLKNPRSVRLADPSKGEPVFG